MAGESTEPALSSADAGTESVTLLDSYRNSLRLQEMRIAVLQSQLEERRIRVAGLENSVSWRLTSPVRLVRSLAAGRLPSGMMLRDVVQRMREIVDSEGAGGLRRRVARRMQVGTRPNRPPERPGQPVSPWTEPVRPAAVPHRSVLIIAELSVPQCAKYRVWQKQEHFRRLGWPCTVLDWHEAEAACSALQCCTEIIFYRVPAVPSVLGLIDEARRLGLEPFWEVDDLIFDEPLYRQNSNLATLEPRLREEVLAGIRLYRAAMLACGRTIASTPVLARCMREAGVSEAVCIENALDDETLSVAQTLRRERLESSEQPAASGADVVIVYGSGTKTHDADFAVAAPAIERLMQIHPDLRLRIIGELNLPDSLLRFAGRIDRIAGTNYRAYLRLLSKGDIAIAPLEATLFNDAKSNIKFQEAAILGMPCVSSPRAAFADIVVHDRNGLLAGSAVEWEQALDRLIRKPAVRDRLGAQALDDVMARYSPDHIATTQLLPLFGPAEMSPPQPGQGRKLRVLMANVFLWPRSFGGATIVAEELARRLHARDDTEISIFTSRGAIAGRPEALLRYDWEGIPVFSAPLPPAGDHVATFDNPPAVRHFAAVLDAVRPDVVHAHSIQGFGAGILRLCQERGIPYVITLHDAWWLCDRQFMVRGDGRYCFQTRIDLRVCQACVPHARHLEARETILHQVLQGAAHLLSPSESHRQLYLANGVAATSVSVSRNGIRHPARPRAPRARGSVPRFGFVGGNEAIKGFHLLRDAFETVTGDNWELVLVDNTLNLGFSSIDVSSWKVSGRIKVIPAYGQNGLDGFFDEIDVLLFPSQWKESYGLTVREALARDVWVVATTPGGQADDIVDGVNGRLIPLDGKAAGLIEAIEEILLVPSILDGYANPHRDRLADYDSQADALRTVLEQACPG
jgi:glycosyltransferase involved in cell wall biosynthesis